MANFGITLGKFNESANFIFGVSTLDYADEEFDIFNNPWIEYVGMEQMNGNGKTKLEVKYDLVQCDEDWLDGWTDDNYDLSYYDDPLCFKDRDAVDMVRNNDWKEYQTPVIGVLYCKNTIENGNWCKTMDEVDAWLLDHP